LQNESNEMFDDCVELDESYFGGIRKGKRERGAAGQSQHTNNAHFFQ